MENGTKRCWFWCKTNFWKQCIWEVFRKSSKNGYQGKTMCGFQRLLHQDKHLLIPFSMCFGKYLHVLWASKENKPLCCLSFFHFLLKKTEVNPDWDTSHTPDLKFTETTAAAIFFHGDSVQVAFLLCESCSEKRCSLDIFLSCLEIKQSFSFCAWYQQTSLNCRIHWVFCSQQISLSLGVG